MFVCVKGSVHVFVWVFHPWRDEKPRTICCAAVGHNTQHCCGNEQYGLPSGRGPVGGSLGSVVWIFIRQIGSLPEKSFCLTGCHWAYMFAWSRAFLICTYGWRPNVRMEKRCLEYLCYQLQSQLTVHLHPQQISCFVFPNYGGFLCQCCNFLFLWHFQKSTGVPKCYSWECKCLHAKVKMQKVLDLHINQTLPNMLVRV